ncbi:MAG: hypothetical protein O7G85_01430 [Planctomycetota bacterium]|nr:hypothetical protein [Planctomycetota bacterium]
MKEGDSMSRHDKNTHESTDAPAPERRSQANNSIETPIDDLHHLPPDVPPPWLVARVKKLVNSAKSELAAIDAIDQGFDEYLQEEFFPKLIQIADKLITRRFSSDHNPDMDRSRISKKRRRSRRTVPKQYQHDQTVSGKCQ